MMPLTTASRGPIYEIVLIDSVALFLLVATVSIIWYFLKKAFPDEVKDVRLFLTFIVVIVPFLILICFGPALMIYNAITAPPWPTLLPLKLSLPQFLTAAVIYIGLTAGLWLRWHKL